MSVSEALIKLEIAERQYERYPFSIPAEHKLRQARTAYNVALLESLKSGEPINEEVTTQTATPSETVKPVLVQKRTRFGHRK